jgi:hypothetical protein
MIIPDPGTNTEDVAVTIAETAVDAIAYRGN